MSEETHPNNKTKRINFDCGKLYKRKKNNEKIKINKMKNKLDRKK